MITTTSTQNLNSLAATELTRIAIHAAEWQHGLHKHNPSFLMFNPRNLEDYAADIELARGTLDLGDSERTALIRRLRISRHAHLLEPGQKLGNEAVTVPDADYTDEQIGLILSTQIDFLLLGLKQPATMEGFKHGGLTYSVTRHGITQKIYAVPTTGFLNFTAATGDEFEAKMWGFRTSFSGTSSYEDEPVNNRIVGAANLHLAKCLMADEASKTERLKGHYDTFKDLDLEQHTVRVEADGEEIIIDLSGDQPTIKDSHRKALPQMMVAGFLKQYAKSIKYRGGAGALEKDLRMVFDNATARMGG